MTSNRPWGAVTGRNTSELRQCAKSFEKITNNLSNGKRVVSVIILSLGPECLNVMGFRRVDGNYGYSLKVAELTTSGGHESTPEEKFSAGLVNTATN